MFHKNVRPFNISEYDMNHEIIEKSLSHRYVMKIYSQSPSTIHNTVTGNNWPVIVQHTEEDNPVSYEKEFICICCRNSLRQKKPKMPDQACANGLKLDDIPQDLQEISTIERRIISLRLPFLTILVMRKYGAHYKVNGPPVNVPTTLNQVIDMLPRMPQQLQIHPLKLKWKLEYKSHYMYDVIRKDNVMAALSWLKEHNHHYRHVQFNSDWYNMIPDDGLSQLIQEDHSHSDSDHNLHTPSSECGLLQQCRTHTHICRCNTCNFDNVHTADETISCTVHHKNPQEINRYAKNVIQNTISQNPKMRNCNSGSNDTMLPLKPTDIDSMQCYSDNEDEDLAEDQAALDQRQELTGDALPTVIQLENLENHVFQCAPGEHNIPKYILLDTDFEVLAFPDLFPHGYGGYYSEGGPKNLPIQKYFQQRLLNVDVGFAQNIEYLFCAQHIVDLKQIQSDANLAIRLS